MKQIPVFNFHVRDREGKVFYRRTGGGTKESKELVASLQNTATWSGLPPLTRWGTLNSPNKRARVLYTVRGNYRWEYQLRSRKTREQL